MPGVDGRGWTAGAGADWSAKPIKTASRPRAVGRGGGGGLTVPREDGLAGDAGRGRPEAAGVEVLGHELDEERRGLWGERQCEGEAGEEVGMRWRGGAGLGLWNDTHGKKGLKWGRGEGNAWAGLARFDDRAVAGGYCAEERLEDKGQGEVERPDDKNQPIRFVTHLRNAE